MKSKDLEGRSSGPKTYILDIFLKDKGKPQ
jgi:hypothetical protein